MSGKEKKPNVRAVDPINQILNEENYENIVLFDDQNNPIEFEQVAVIPLDNDPLLYTILIPVTPMQGVGEGEGVVMAIDEEKHDIQVVNDEKTIDAVLEVYQQLIGDGEEEK